MVRVLWVIVASFFYLFIAVVNHMQFGVRDLMPFEVL